MRALAKYQFKRGSVLLLSMLLAFEPAAYAQYEGSVTPPPPNAPAPAQHAFSQQELDQMLAPIALYPDPLLSQILMASTYPLEVVDAARWSRANPNLGGDDAVRAVQQMDWDPSVKSLVAFPQILQVMDEKLDWTERLGDAFLAQEAQVMSTVQNLRQRAYAAGNLSSNDQIRVEPEGQIIVVEPANPDIIYVPYYDPFVFYGLWWWPDYPPIYWAPWPGYYYGAGYATGFGWGIGITITAGFFFGNFDWYHHRVNVVNVNNYYYGSMVRGGRPPRRIVNAAPGVWQHDPDHRRGVPYREVTLRQQYGRDGRASASTEARRDYRGYDQSAIGVRAGSGIRQIEGGSATPLTQRPETRGIPGGSLERRAPEPRPNMGSRPLSRPDERGSQSRPSTPRLSSRPAPQIRPPALEDIGRGANVRDYSSRGRASHEGAARSQSSTPARQPSGAAPRGGIRPPRPQGK